MKAGLVRLILLLCIWSVALSSPVFAQSGTGIQRVTSALKSKFGHWVATGAVAGILLTAPAFSETPVTDSPVKARIWAKEYRTDELVKITTWVKQQRGEDAVKSSRANRIALEQAAARGDRAEITRILEQGVFLTSIRWSAGIAAANGHLLVTAQLIDVGPLPATKSLALYYAAASGQFEVVEWLLDNYPELSSSQWKLDRVLVYASAGHSGYSYHHKELPVPTEAERLKLVELLAERGANNFNWAYKRALISGHLVVARRLVELGANDFDEGLRWAARRGDTEMASWLIARGAGQLNLVLRDAARAGHEKMIDLLLAAGADDINGALAVAALFGHVHLFDKLVRQGADAFDAALEYAMTYSDEISNEVVGELVRLGATISKVQ